MKLLLMFPRKQANAVCETVKKNKTKQGRKNKKWNENIVEIEIILIDNSWG